MIQINGKHFEDESMVRVDTNEGKHYVGFIISPSTLTKFISGTGREAIGIYSIKPSEYAGVFKSAFMRMTIDPVIVKKDDIQNIWLLDTVEHSTED